MRQLLLTAALLAVPTLASAQAVGVLGDPGEEPNAPRASTPEGYHYPGVPTVETSTPQPYPMMAMDHERPPMVRTDARPTLSFGRSFGHSWMGFGIGAGVGAAVGAIAAEASCDNDWSCGGRFMLGVAIGAPVTAPLGAAISVWAWGDARGAGGNFFASLAGAYLGGGLGFGLSMLMAQTNDMFTIITAMWLGPVLGTVLANLGAAAGYHLSRSGSEEAGGAPSAVVVPTLAPTEDGRGGTIGVVGMF